MQWPNKKRTKGQTIFYNTLHIKIKLKNTTPQNTEVNSGAPEGYQVLLHFISNTHSQQTGKTNNTNVANENFRISSTAESQ